MKRRYQLGWAGLRSKASLMSGMPLSQSPVRLQALPRSARMSLSCGLRISARSYAAMLRVGSRLILQLSLLVDQEFGGLSFPVAGFGDGLMEPAPERPSENEVDADAQLEAGDEAADLGHAEGNECARSLAPFWPARLTRIAARKASASIDRVTWRYQPCQLRTS